MKIIYHFEIELEAVFISKAVKINAQKLTFFINVQKRISEQNSNKISVQIEANEEEDEKKNVFLCKTTTTTTTKNLK